MRAVFAIWFGGLTFYGAVVVPLGSERFGASEQGVVTRAATHWLHALALLAALGLGCAAWNNTAVRRHGRWLSALLLAALLLAALTGVLVILHSQLVRQIDPATDAPLDPARFYQWHRAYLAVTTAQWLVGLATIHQRYA